MLVRIVSLILLIIISAFGCFAQTYEEQRRMEEEEQRIKDLAEQVREWQTPKFTKLVASFLPEEKDAWTISISRSGGFLGETEKLVGLINSKGMIACNTANRLLPNDSLNDLSSFIQTKDFKILDKTFKPTPSFCRDCYKTTLTLNRRPKKNKIKTYQYSWNLLPEASSEIGQLYEKAKKYTDCQ